MPLRQPPLSVLVRRRAGAKALNVTPAAVNSQIRSLEELLGMPLFLRSGRKITLTDAGKTLLPRRSGWFG